MNELILIFSVPASVVLIMHELELFGYRIYPLVVKLLPFKPFTCELCLSFWTYLGVKITLFGFNKYTIFEAFLSAFIGNMYARKLIKF